jgi:hypothetical protein
MRSVEDRSSPSASRTRQEARRATIWRHWFTLGRDGGRPKPADRRGTGPLRCVQSRRLEDRHRQRGQDSAGVERRVSDVQDSGCAPSLTRQPKKAERKALERHPPPPVQGRRRLSRPEKCDSLGILVIRSEDDCAIATNCWSGRAVGTRCPRGFTDCSFAHRAGISPGVATLLL